jgi:hypothetical protein
VIVLNTTSDVIRVITGSAAAVDVHVTYVDNVASVPYLAARQNTAISVAATTTILSSPGASTQRQIKVVTIVAKGGTNTITIQFFDGTTAYLLFGNGLALGTGETIEYEDVTGWRVFDVNGQMKQSNFSPVQLTGNVIGGPSSGTVATTIVNIPNDAECLGDLLVDAISAPASPAASKLRKYYDSSTLAPNAKDSGGNVFVMPAALSAALTSQWVTFISSDGHQHTLQPSFSDIFGVATNAQLPAFTGDVTKPSGSGVTTLTNIPNHTTMAGNLQANSIAGSAPGSGTNIYIDSGFGGLAVWPTGNASFTQITVSINQNAPAHNFFNSFGNNSTFGSAQPDFSDLTGTAALAQLPAVLINVQVLTSGVGATYTPTSGTKTQIVEGCGGGGGGGGASVTTGPNGAGGGGGGGGGYFRRRYTITTTGTYTIGAAGSAGAAAAGAGGTGGNTTFTDGTTLCTGNGGNGGSGMAGGATGSSAVMANGALGGGASNGNVNIAGNGGSAGIKLLGTTIGLWVSGAGGASMLGSGQGGQQGPIAFSSTVLGVNGSGFGGGGGGGSVAQSPASASSIGGGSGAPGGIIVWEFA